MKKHSHGETFFSGPNPTALRVHIRAYHDFSADALTFATKDILGELHNRDHNRDAFGRSFGLDPFELTEKERTSK